MVSIKKGVTYKHAVSEKLIETFKQNDAINGILYIGYPILFLGEEPITVDALWISEEYGVIIFDLIEGKDCNDRQGIQDNLYGSTEALLTSHQNLKRGRKLAVQIEVISFAPACFSIDNTYKAAYTQPELVEVMNGLTKWDFPELFKPVVSIIQSVVTLKTKNKRDNVTKEDSKGAKLKKLENTIATLDNEQEEAVLEFFDGLQRIRGLAGSGKTIVLALKAAYLHSQYEDWNIAVAFNTRSLKEQFKELISKFVAEKKRGLPDWEKIRVVNAWGKGSDTIYERGIYYDFCLEHGLEYFDYGQAGVYAISIGAKDSEAFNEVCKKAIAEVKHPKAKYDAILVDEAQDLSEGFLNLCYRFLKPPKRLIYAYDELQKLNEGSSLRNPKVIFGSPAQDTILKKCYRNSRPLLVAAHALGFGIYRETGLVQFFDQPLLWRDVGYVVKNGELKANNNVTLFRNTDASPEYLESHSPLEDLIVFKAFKNYAEQAEWIASEIQKNLSVDELLHKDIVVINPIAYTTEKRVAEVRSLLAKQNINSHISGKFDPNKFFEADSITLSGINRAKGNEVPMVYIMNADDCYGTWANSSHDFNLIKKRNILFTAITRSKAWVRVCGVGPAMQKLEEEYETVKHKKFELQFRYPTDEEILNMNVIHRDISQTDKEKLVEEVDSLKEVAEIVRKVKEGKAYVEDYPKEFQAIIKAMLQ